MMRMGPEALLVKSRVEPRVDLEEFARTEYRVIEYRAVETRVRAELEYFPPSRSVSGRLAHWGQRWFRRGGSNLAKAPAPRPLTVEVARAGASPTRPTAGPTLASMPAMLASRRASNGPAPSSGLPVFP